MEVGQLSPEALLTTTRTVRRRLDLTRPVDLDTVRDCLRVAVQAPSRTNTQPWRWVIVADPAQRAAVGYWFTRAWRERYGSGQGDHPSATVRGAARLADRIADVPVLLVPCLELDSADLPEGNQASLWGSLLPAVWSYMLAARARNLGTAWTTVHLAYETQVAEVLGLPNNVRQAAMIPTAHTVGTDFRPAARRPLDEVLYLDRWS